MNVSVYVLRTALGNDALLTQGDDLCLNAEVVRADVVDFETALEGGDPEKAAALYAAPFLDGFFLTGADEFERWVDGQRERLRRAFGRAVEELAERAAARGDDEAAAEWWRLLVAGDPTNSRIALQLMSALAATGDRVGAIRHAQEHATLLREEIGAEPDPQVTELAERLRAGPITGSRKPAARASAAPPAPSSDPPSIPAPAPVPRRQLAGRPLLVVGVLTVLTVLAAATFAVPAARLWFAEPAPAHASVAVLPFVNMGGDPNDDYFSDGMTEELIHALTGVDGLLVTARTSAFQFKGQNIDLREVGRRLGVASVLEGSVRRSGLRLRVTVQLVSTRDGTHLWSNVYERETADALALQEEIARSIVATLRPRLTASTSFVASHSQDIEAYHLYLKGRYALSRRTPAMVKQGIDYFEQAITRDPNYALAWSGLADAHARLYDISGRPPAELVPRVRAAAHPRMGVGGSRSRVQARDRTRTQSRRYVPGLQHLSRQPGPLRGSARGVPLCQATRPAVTEGRIQCGGFLSPSRAIRARDRRGAGDDRAQSQPAPRL
jgi:TolB-like protein